MIFENGRKCAKTGKKVCPRLRDPATWPLRWGCSPNLGQTGIATSLLCTIHPCNGPEAMSRTSRSNGVEQRWAEGEEDAGPGSLVIGVTGVGLETQVRYSLNSTEISWNDGL